MSPEQRRNNVSIAFVSVAMAVAGTILGAGITWGSSITRLAAFERQVEAQSMRIDALTSMQLSVIRIEQATTDILRRLDKIEKDSSK
jgi:hypothetical protein